MREATFELPAQLRLSGSHPKLELKQVSLWWQLKENGDPDWVVSDLTASIDVAQEPVWLKGRSAAGKSTLLRALAGHWKRWQPYPRSLKFTGSITFASEAIDACAERGAVGYAPQQHLFVEHLSVEENLRLPFAGPLGKNRSPNGDFSQLATGLRLENKLKRPVHSLSGGERDRVGFMRAYLLAQRLLVLDEPFGSSDEDVKKEMYRLCFEWLQDGQARLLIFTSHDPDDAVELRARTLQLRCSTMDKERLVWQLV